MSLKNLTSSSFIINFTIFLSGILAFPWPGTDSGSYYYKEENIDQEILIENGIKIKRWLTTNSSEDMMNWSMAPPHMTKIEIPIGSIFPPNDDSNFGYWHTSDTYYVVSDGNIQFGNIHDEYGFIYGDVYWAMAGHRHGPIICKDIGNRNDTSGKCDILIMTTSIFNPQGINEQVQPSDENPSVNISLIKEKTYRQIGDGKEWHSAGEHSHGNCTDGKKPNLMSWHRQEVGNAPPLFRAHWFSKCSVGYHYHPCGAMYFIAYGNMMYHGDLKEGMEDIGTTTGEVRWTGPGHPYGPEYNDDNEVMFSVLGFECKPEEGDPPKGPFKMQKELIFTHIFNDEL